MSTEFWIAVTIVVYALSNTAIALRKLGYAKVADIVEIFITFGASALAARSGKAPPPQDPPDPGVGPTMPPPALPKAPPEILGRRSERGGMLAVGAFLVVGCAGAEDVPKKLSEGAQEASSALVVLAPLTVEGYRAAQKLCILEAHGDADAAVRCVNGVRARWKIVGEAFGSIHEVRCTFEPERSECLAPNSSAAAVPSASAR